MDVCPNCQRKLISHASSKCNWCGCVMTDPAYLAQAEANRGAYRREQAMHDAQALSFFQTNLNNLVAPLGITGLSRMNPFARRRIMEETAAAVAAQAAAQAAAQTAAQRDAAARALPPQAPGTWSALGSYPTPAYNAPPYGEAPSQSLQDVADQQAAQTWGGQPGYANYGGGAPPPPTWGTPVTSQPQDWAPAAPIDNGYAGLQPAPSPSAHPTVPQPPSHWSMTPEPIDTDWQQEPEQPNDQSITQGRGATDRFHHLEL